MDKKSVIGSAILGIATIGLVTLIISSDTGAQVVTVDKGVVSEEKLAESKDCEPSEVSLNFEDSVKKVSKKLCMTSAQYSKVKADLKADMQANKSKGYDFDINNRDLLFAVLSKEIKDKPLSMEGTTKEKIKEELLKLLD